jgi:serine/threonine protein kinase
MLIKCSFQITEALSFLHYSGHVLHRNVCPASILVTKKGTWKLAGLEFTGEVKIKFYIPLEHVCEQNYHSVYRNYYVYGSIRNNE